MGGRFCKALVLVLIVALIFVYIDISALADLTNESVTVETVATVEENASEDTSNVKEDVLEYGEGTITFVYPSFIDGTTIKLNGDIESLANRILSLDEKERVLKGENSIIEIEVVNPEADENAGKLFKDYFGHSIGCVLNEPIVAGVPILTKKLGEDEPTAITGYVGEYVLTIPVSEEELSINEKYTVFFFRGYYDNFPKNSSEGTLDENGIVSFLFETPCKLYVIVGGDVNVGRDSAVGLHENRYAVVSSPAKKENDKNSILPWVIITFIALPAIAGGIVLYAKKKKIKSSRDL